MGGARCAFCLFYWKRNMAVPLVLSCPVQNHGHCQGWHRDRSAWTHWGAKSIPTSPPSLFSQGNPTSKRLQYNSRGLRQHFREILSFTCSGWAFWKPGSPKMICCTWQGKTSPALGWMGTTQPSPCCNTAKPVHPLLGIGLNSTI